MLRIRGTFPHFLGRFSSFNLSCVWDPWDELRSRLDLELEGTSPFWPPELLRSTSFFTDRRNFKRGVLALPKMLVMTSFVAVVMTFLDPSCKPLSSLESAVALNDPCDCLCEQEGWRGLTQILIGVCAQNQDQTLIRSLSHLKLHGQINCVIGLKILAALPGLSQ